MKILVLNSGSSSVKYKLLEMTTETVLAAGKVERIGSDDASHVHQATGHPEQREITTILDHGASIRRVLAALTRTPDGVIHGPQEIAAVGHRMVHGGEAFTASTLVTDEVRRGLRAIMDLAPLHNPANLLGIESAQALLPGVPQAAVFDTAFHATMPRSAFLYALPYAMYKRHRVRRYGFHGTSHRYVAERLADCLGRTDLQGLKVITCHLGNGCSACAIQDGQSIDTSMGFTPLEGLVMGTRSGDVDAGALAYIMTREELTPTELNSMLNKHSGLRGISGISGDMRQLEEEMDRGETRAREAFMLFCYRLRKYIGSYAAAMDGLDALVFTGGIGENSRRVRAEVCRHLSFLGVQLDEARNAGQGERPITSASARCQVWVIPTNEELVIARDTAALIAGAGR